jgi:phosphatidylinositol alpha-mannosyltransferase
VRVGLVCPYTWDVPGGVQAHVRDFAETLLSLGHEVDVATPAEDEDNLPPYVTSMGRAVSVPYNGSVARLSFGPLTAARVRRWLRNGDFDVLHIHEPFAPSVSVLSLWSAQGPVVGTFHASVERSRALLAAKMGLQPALEKIHARIAVSPAARKYVVEHLGGSVVLIPNGVSVADFATAEPLPGWPGDGGAIGFLGRIDEPRKGLQVLLPALERMRTPARLLVAGPGDVDEVAKDLPAAVRERVTFLGQVSEEDKRRFFHSVDVYCAPNTGGESFGIVLIEAMAAGTAIVASELDAFRRVLDDGDAGVMVPVDDPDALAAALDDLLADPARRRAMVKRGSALVRRYDWPAIAEAVVGVYETVVARQPDDAPTRP